MLIDMKEKKGFVKFIPPGSGRPKHPINFLKEGELYCIEGRTRKDLYTMVYNIEKRTGFKYAYEETTNGIVIKRIK